jgi:succinylglutamic semialdehyde dehydrogenase
MKDGTVFQSIDPATGEVVWSGPAATPAIVNQAVRVSRMAFRDWSGTRLEERVRCIQAFAKVLESRANEFAEAISKEVGKPAWEARQEVRSMISKAELSVRAFAERCPEVRDGDVVTRFKPHGVAVVLGPFNLPGHLPNGQILPALLAGNTVLFKPSEHAPLVAEMTLAAWQSAGLPDGVLQVLQGGGETGESLARHHDIDALFFTGGSKTGCWLAELFARTPQKILALEMGGNNPLVVWDPLDTRTAALQVIQSAFLTAGQRCTCARRLILPEGPMGDVFLEELAGWIDQVRVDSWNAVPEPFCGPVISANAADQILAQWRFLTERGAKPLVEMRRLGEGNGFLRPGLVDVTAVPDRPDEEVFGPLLQVIRVPDFHSAIAEANHTRFGLAAGLFSGSSSLFEVFWREIRAGIINWNNQTTGASGKAPFGGVGLSGNHRPAGFFAADFCSYPVAGMESADPELHPDPPLGLMTSSSPVQPERNSL